MMCRPSELFGRKRNGSGMIVILFLLCLRINIAVSGDCPSDMTWTLAEGQRCMQVHFTVFGMRISTIPWNSPGLRPGHDCFPEGDYSYRTTRGSETCDYSITIKAIHCGSLYVPHGSQTCSGYDDDVWGSRCSISCRDGYRLYGDSSWTCLQSGHWDKQQPTCKELCTWRNTQCWPGDCGDGLTSQCVCRHGFTRRNSYSALCELSDQPDLNTCRMGVTDSQGTQTDSPTRGDITSCPNQQDTGIRTQPTTLTFTIKAQLDLDLGSNHPAHVLDPGKVGVTGARIDVIKRFINGTETNVAQKLLNSRPECQETANSTHPVYGSTLQDCVGKVTLPKSLHLDDNESLCADIDVSGGGYYKLQDVHQSPKDTVTFPATHRRKRICFIMDMTTLKRSSADMPTGSLVAIIVSVIVVVVMVVVFVVVLVRRTRRTQADQKPRGSGSDGARQRAVYENQVFHGPPVGHPVEDSSIVNAREMSDLRDLARASDASNEHLTSMNVYGSLANRNIEENPYDALANQNSAYEGLSPKRNENRLNGSLVPSGGQSDDYEIPDTTGFNKARVAEVNREAYENVNLASSK